MLPLPKPDRTVNVTAALIASAHALGDADLASRFLLPKLERKLVKLRREMRRFEADFHAAKRALVAFLDDIHVTKPAAAATKILQAHDLDADVIKNILCQVDFVSSHAKLAMIDLLPKLLSLTEAVIGADRLWSEANCLCLDISDVRDVCLGAPWKPTPGGSQSA